MSPTPKGPQASRLRQRKHELLRRYGIPAEALPGSLSLSYRRCGSSSCHCQAERGHPSWTLTFVVDGKKYVEHIPAEMVEEVRRRVEEGREFRDAMVEVLAANAQLLVLGRRQKRRRR